MATLLWYKQEYKSNLYCFRKIEKGFRQCLVPVMHVVTPFLEKTGGVSETNLRIFHYNVRNFTRRDGHIPMRFFQIGLGARGTTMVDFFTEYRGLSWRYMIVFFLVVFINFLFYLNLLYIFISIPVYHF